MLSILVAFWYHLNLRGNQERWIETHSELSNQVKISRFNFFHVFSWPSVSNCSQVSYKLTFRHSYTIINDFDNFSVFIILNFDLELSLVTKDALVRVR